MGAKNLRSCVALTRVIAKSRIHVSRDRVEPGTEELVALNKQFDALIFANGSDKPIRGTVEFFEYVPREISNVIAEGVECMLPLSHQGNNTFAYTPNNEHIRDSWYMKDGNKYPFFS